MGAYKASRVQHKSGGYSLKYPIVLINRREKIIAIHYLSMGKKKTQPIHYQSIPYSMFDTTPCRFSVPARTDGDREGASINENASRCIFWCSATKSPKPQAPECSYLNPIPFNPATLQPLHSCPETTNPKPRTLNPTPRTVKPKP